MQTVPYKLIELRKHSNLSQAYVADVLKIDSLSYMAYENGREPLTEDIAVLLSRFYKISKNDLLNDEKELNLASIPYVEKDATVQIEAIKKNTKKKNDLNKEMVIKCGVVFCVVIALIVGFVLLNQKPQQSATLNLKQDSNHLLVANDGGYIYFSGNNLSSRGNNQNNTLEITNVSDVIKVEMNNEVSALLKKEGTIELIGSGKENYDISNWPKTKDHFLNEVALFGIDAGNTLWCTSQNDGYCPSSTIENVVSVVVSGEDYLIVDESGIIYLSDETLKQRISALEKVKQIVRNSSTLAVLYTDGSVAVIESTNSNFIAAQDFEGVTKLVLINDAIFALTESKEVLVASANSIYDEVKSWSVSDIAGAKDYLIGYDGKSLVGVGNNDHNKFDKKPVVEEAIKLGTINNSQVIITDKNIQITFDEVPNADYYVITIGDSVEFKVIGAKASVETSHFISGQTYIIKVQAKSNNSAKYLDSDIVEYSMLYEAVEPTPSVSPSPSPSIVPTESPETPESPDPGGEPDSTVSPTV